MDCAAFGLDQQVRAVCAVPVFGSAKSDDDTSTHRFLAGTATFRGGNKIVLLQYGEERKLIDAAADWSFEPEVYSISAAPDAPLAAIVGNGAHGGADSGAAGGTSSSSSGPTLSVMKLDTPQHAMADPTIALTMRGGVGSFAWHPKGSSRQSAIVSADGGLVAFGAVGGNGGDSSQLTLADLPSAVLPTQRTAALPSSSNAAVTAAQRRVDGLRSLLCWDPHHADVVYATCGGPAVFRVDARSARATALFDGDAMAAAGGVTAIDHNPNQMYVLATAGADGFVRFWDVRRPDAPTGEACFGAFRAHDSSVAVVRFNPFRDELLLTAAADHSAKVWFEPKAPPAAAEQQTGGSSKSPKPAPAGLRAGLAGSMAQCGDAVYAAAWSAASPWVYVACTYAGKLLVDEVPREYKMGLLLAE